MKVLVAYGTSEGQTRKIAERIGGHIYRLGHSAQLFDTATSPAELHVRAFDKVIIAGSVHNQLHQESIELFVTARLPELRRHPTLFLSVSLSAAFTEGEPDARKYVETFLAVTGWQPNQVLLVAGALRYSEYDYFKEQIVEHLVLKGRQVEGPKGDYEFTDWQSLSRTVDEIVKA